MKISKTAFKEYAKCERVYPLENIYIKKLDSNISYFDEEKITDILSLMFDEDTGDDLIINDDESLKEMLEFYNEVERHAVEIASKKFGGEIKYHKETKDQKVFSYVDESGHNFYCYLDGYLEKDNEVIIIEVKATTSRKFLEAGSKKNSLFKDDNNILVLNKPEEGDKVFNNHYEKLFDIFSSTGKYVFDLAIERYIVEESIKRHYPELLKKKFKYYLGILNSEYVFDGKYKDGQPVYSDELIKFVDLSDITKEYLPKVDNIKNDIIEEIKAKELPKEVFGKKCGYKSQSECIFIDICFPKLKEKGSITEYMQTRSFGPGKMSKADLINKGLYKLDDIDIKWLNNENNIIQRNCFTKGIEYINKSKIKAGIHSLKYPIYHLDFESFPSPLPRFSYEKPYTQSLFQFSVHIEKSPGKCDFIEDNYSYLVSDFKDNRRELVEKLIEVINLSEGGTVLVYNMSFEYSRLSELIGIFPEYKEALEKIQDAMFDLIDIVKTNKNLYTNLGFSEEESKIVNYYHSDLRGSYSIKKVLPLFSDLSYSDLSVQNGNEAIYSYIKFRRLSKEEIEEIRTDLIDYCRQDTWAMVVILNELRNRVK